MIDNLSNFKKTEFSSLRLEMERENSIAVKRTVAAYFDVLTDGNQKNIQALIDLYPAGITKGHYFRGVE